MSSRVGFFLPYYPYLHFCLPLSLYPRLNRFSIKVKAAKLCWEAKQITLESFRSCWKKGFFSWFFLPEELSIKRMKEVNVAFMVSHLLNLCSSSVVPPKVGIHHEQLLQSVGQEKLQASAFALFHLVYAALIMVTFH